MKTPQQFWDKVAPRYAKSPVRDEASYQKKLAVTQAYFRPDWSVFEFGCGTGSTAIVHAPYVKDILATDISGEMLNIAQGKARSAGIENIRFQRGSLDSLELPAESFDAVLGLNILHLLEDVEAAVARAYQMLKAGGIFVSSTVLVDELKLRWRLLLPVMQLLGVAPHLNRFDRQGLVSILSNAGFSVDYEWQPQKFSLFIVARKSA